MENPQPSGTKLRKTVNRNVAIALWITCIILVAGLGLTLGYYAIMINNKDNTIANLTEKADFTNFTVLADNQTVIQTAGNCTSWTFTANFSGYVRVLVWSSTTNNTYIRVTYNATIPSWYTFSDAKTNYQTVFSPEGAWEYYQYDNQVNVGNASLNQIFPVFPWLNQGPPYGNGPAIVEVRVGSTNVTENASEQITVVYYY